MWILVALGLWNQAALAAEGLTDKERPEAKRLYTAKCAKCHRFYAPKDYSDEKWGSWMKKMKKKARLSDEQHRLVLAYTYELKKGG